MFDHDNLFRSKEELKNWIVQKSFAPKEQTRLIKNIKRKEWYGTKTEIKQTQINPINQEFNISSNDSKIFLNRLTKIEEEPIFRLILKITLNININYLNDELVYLNEINTDLDFLKKIQDLYNQPWNSHKGNFFLLAHRILGQYSPKIGQIRHLSIQKRIFRSFKKIKEAYYQDELHSLLLDVKEKFYAELLKAPPLILSAYSTESCEFPIQRNSLNNLKAADLSNNKLEEFPSTLKDAHNIEYVNISGNRFSEIPEELFRLRNPKIIMVQGQDYKFNEGSVMRYKTLYPNCRIVL